MVKFVAVNVVVVFEISVGAVAKLSVELCHLVTVPVLPVNVKVVEFVPVQTDVPPEIVPPTEAGSTLIVSTEEYAAEHAPLVTTAL